MEDGSIRCSRGPPNYSLVPGSEGLLNGPVMDDPSMAGPLTADPLMAGPSMAGPESGVPEMAVRLTHSAGLTQTWLTDEWTQKKTAASAKTSASCRCCYHCCERATSPRCWALALN